MSSDTPLKEMYEELYKLRADLAEMTRQRDEWHRLHTSMAITCGEQVKKAEQNSRDAVRYRWLRSNAMHRAWKVIARMDITAEVMDETIDAAIASEIEVK
jgi:predicted translin family RNA/ssDNA-binding protein